VSVARVTISLGGCSSGYAMLLHHRLAMLLARAFGHGLLAVVHHLGVVMLSPGALLTSTLMLLMLGMPSVWVIRWSSLRSSGHGEDKRQGAKYGLHVISPRISLSVGV
jgi:hypothetical protein